MVDQSFLNKKFGDGVDSAFQLQMIPDKQGGTVSYDRNWVNDKSPLTIYLSKDLLKTEDGYRVTLARMEDKISNYAYELLKAKEKGQPDIKYSTLEKAVEDNMSKYAYTTDLANRPDFCFVGGTLVHTDRGLVPIKDINVGDMVLSRDQNNPEGELVYKPVLRTIVTESVPVYFATFTPESVRKIPFSQRTNLDLYVDILCTAQYVIYGMNLQLLSGQRVKVLLLQQYITLKLPILILTLLENKVYGFITVITVLPVS